MLNIESNFLLFSVFAYALAMLSYFFFGVTHKEGIAKFGKAFLAIGFVLQTISIGSRVLASGRLPLSNLYESMVIFAWGMVIIYLIVEAIYKLRKIGVVLTPIVFLAALYASTLDKSIHPLVPALQSNWLLVHVAVAVISYGAFAVSFAAAVLYLLRDYFKFNWLPSLEKLDKLTYKLIALAMPFLTLVIITGAVWAEQAWGSYWSFDPKETWSLITWLIYLSYLHARLVLKWKGRTIAWFAIVGFIAVLFTYLGVNLLLSGLHSYA